MMRSLPLSRTLSIPLLEVAYRFASVELSDKDRSERLMIALREHTSDAEAGGRTRSLLSRIWLRPPEPAAEMVRWAIEHPEQFPDRRLMHLGALIATVPFVGSALVPLGRSFALDQPMADADLRQRMVERWGDTPAVRDGARKTMSSLRNMGVIAGGGRHPIGPCQRLTSSPISAAWLAHVLLISRDAESIDVRDLAGAPELFWAEQIEPDIDYPHLEIHTESINRRVMARL